MRAVAFVNPQVGAQTRAKKCFSAGMRCREQRLSLHGARAAAKYGAFHLAYYTATLLIMSHYELLAQREIEVTVRDSIW